MEEGSREVGSGRREEEGERWLAGGGRKKVRGGSRVEEVGWRRKTKDGRWESGGKEMVVKGMGRCKEGSVKDLNTLTRQRALEYQ